MNLSRFVRRAPRTLSLAARRHHMLRRAAIEGLESRTLLSSVTYTDETTATLSGATIAGIEARNSVDLVDTGWHGLNTSPSAEVLKVATFDVDIDDDGIADRYLTGVKVEYGTQALAELTGEADLLEALAGSESSFLFVNLLADSKIAPPSLAEADSPVATPGDKTVQAAYTTGSPGIEVKAGETTGPLQIFEFDSESATFDYSDLSKLLGFSTYSSGELEFTATDSGLSLKSFGPNGSSNDQTTRRVAARSFVSVTYEYEEIVRDARISIAPDATNGIGEDHTFTTTVEYDDGLATGLPADVAAFYGADAYDGFAPVAGQNVTVTLTNAGGAVADPAGPFNGVTDANGQYEVTFTSQTAGTVTGNASADDVNGFADLDVDTDPLTLAIPNSTDETRPGSGPAVKTFVDGALRFLKQDGNSAALGGATFQVTRTHDRFGVDIVDEVTIIVDNGVGDADTDAGEVQLNGLYLGTYTIKETIAPAGYTLDPDTETVILTLANPSNADATFGDIVPIFVNTQEQRGQGLTPGFWKRNATFVSKVTGKVGQAWIDAGYSPSQKLSSLGFSGTGYDNLTMLQALNLGGGGMKALLRHAVAGILNAGHPGVDYFMTKAQIVAAVNAAVGNPTAIEELKNLLDANNNLGAGVDQHGRY